MPLCVTLEFRGGAELLFGKQKQHNVTLPDAVGKWTIANLLIWMMDNLLTERRELFLQGRTVRPGILVLVNDTDWELCGELSYELNSNDNILFISTLHGG